MTQQAQERRKEREEKSKTVKTKNPATEEVLNEYDILTKEQINEKARKARNAFEEWSKDSNKHKRADLLHDFAQELRKNKEALAKTATKEMGKAIKEARSEVEKCAWAIESGFTEGWLISRY